MFHTILLVIIESLKARICLLQVLESDDAAGIVCSHCGTAQTLAQHTVTGAEGGGVVGCVEDCALCLGRWEVRWGVLRLVMLVRGGRG